MAHPQGYPGQPQQPPAYPPPGQYSQPGYPASGGYPPTPGYPPAGGTPPASVAGYPGAPAPTGGYPGSPQGGYPGAPPTGGYPPPAGSSAPGYPPAPGSSPGYPPAPSPGYPPAGSPTAGYPPPPGGAPAGYPPPGQPPYPAAPGQSQGPYPPQQPPTGYPPPQQSQPYGAPPPQQPQPYGAAPPQGYPPPDPSNPYGIPAAPYGAPPPGAPYPPPGGDQQDKGFGKVALGAAGVAGAGFVAYQGYQHFNNNGQQQPPPPAGYGQQQPPTAGPPGQQGGQNWQQYAMMAGAGLAVGGLAAGGLAFFHHMNKKEVRNYILVVDRSGSMAGSRWREAEKAVKILAPAVCKADPDGITLYFFSCRHTKHDRIKSEHEVQDLFNNHRPSGTTNLADALQAAFREHFEEFSRCKKPTTILVITDGAPNSREAVKQEIATASNRIGSDPELSVSFIQIGDDHGAKQFLKELDDNMKGRCKYDICDTMSYDKMKGKSFDEVVNLSVND